MATRLGIRQLNGAIERKPDVDVNGNPYSWGSVSVIVSERDKTRFYVVPVGVKLTPELDEKLFAEEVSVQPAAPEADAAETPSAAEAAAPAESPPPVSRRKGGNVEPSSTTE